MKSYQYYSTYKFYSITSLMHNNLTYPYIHIFTATYVSKLNYEYLVYYKFCVVQLPLN